VRSWTVNTTGYWLFDRITSGVIFKEFDDKAKPPKLVYSYDLNNAKAGLKAIAGSRNYFWSEDFPKEKETTLNALKTLVEGTKAGSSPGGSFGSHDYILCFSRRTEKKLKALKASAQENDALEREAKIVLLGDCDWYRASVHDNDKDLQRLAGSLKVELKKFLTNELDWYRPPGNLGTAGGHLRTLQLLVPDKKTHEVLGKRLKNTQELEKKTGCQIWPTWSAKDGPLSGYIVYVTGPKRKLEAVRKVFIDD
jgi:KH domain